MTATTLVGKIAAASIEAGTFTADKTNKEQGYSYISADQVLSRAGLALARQGVIMVPQILETALAIVERLPWKEERPKSPRIDATVKFTMVVTDGEKEISFPWEGRGSDYMTPDKAIYKAITSGHKYALMKLLNIGVGNEDGEHESERGEDPERNPDPVSDALWEAWTKLAARADLVKVPHVSPDRARVTRPELKQAGIDLLELVEAAEAQARAESEAPA